MGSLLSPCGCERDLLPCDREVSRHPTTTNRSINCNPATTNCGVCRGPDASLKICSNDSSGCVHTECLSEMLKPNSDVPICPICNKECTLFVKTILELNSPNVAVLRPKIKRRQVIDNLQPNETLA